MKEIIRVKWGRGEGERNSKGSNGGGVGVKEIPYGGDKITPYYFLKSLPASTNNDDLRACTFFVNTIV